MERPPTSPHYRHTWGDGRRSSPPVRATRFQLSASAFLLIEFVDFLLQAGITAHQRNEVNDVDQPGSCIGGIKKGHRTLLLGSSNASSARVSSTSRFIRSSR